MKNFKRGVGFRTNAQFFAEKIVSGLSMNGWDWDAFSGPLLNKMTSQLENRLYDQYATLDCRARSRLYARQQFNEI